MVVVRLARGGAKKRPFYHIVVTDSRRPRDSGHIERLGYFNPFATKAETPVLLNRDRYDYWISQGAKSSQRVSSIISKLDKGKFIVKAEVETATKKTEAEEIVEVEISDTDKKTEAGAEKSEIAPAQTELELGEAQEGKQEGKQVSAEAPPESESSKQTAAEQPSAEASESSETGKSNDNK